MATAIATPTAPLPHKRWFLVGLLFFFLAINAQYLFKIHRSERPTRSAVLRWLPQIEEISHGENIWIKHNFPNPPIMALILEPLTHLPPVSAAMVWFGLKVAMVVLALHLVLMMLERPGTSFPTWAKLLALMLSLRPIQGDLVHGNVNLFILLLVVLSLYSFTRGRDWAAGLCLGLAIACKVTPALFVPYFLWKRAWKTLAATLVGLGLFFLIVPSLFLGWEQNETFLKSWYSNMVKPFVTKGEVFYSEHNNQSLPGFAARMLTHSPSFSDYDEKDQYQPLEYHNVVELDPKLAGWLVKACMAVFVLLVLWTCRTPTLDRRDWRLVAEFSIVLLGMLLFSERTWKHHCVTLLMPFAVLSYALAVVAQTREMRWYLAGTLVLSMLLMSATSTGLFDSQDRIGKLAQVYGAYVWMFVLLLGALFTVWRSQGCSERETHSGEPTRVSSAPMELSDGA